MRVIRGLPPSADGPVALTIGNFDGVHRGHQAMLARLIEAAEDLRAAAGGADLRSASARILRAGDARRRACRRCATSSSCFARYGVATDVSSRASTQRLAALAAGSVHRRRAGARGSARAGCWSATISASARAAPAISRLLRAHARDVQRRGDAHRRGRRRARVVAPRCARRSPPATSTHAAALLGRPYAIAAASRTATSSAATWAFRRPTCRCGACRRVAGIFAVRVHGLGAAPRDGRGEPRRAPDGQRGRRAAARSVPVRFRRSDLRPAHRRRVPAQAARRGTLRRPRHADAADSRRRRAGARLFRAQR